MPQGSEPERLNERTLHNTREALNRIGVTGKWMASDDKAGPDWIVTAPNGQVTAIEIKHTPILRSTHLQAQLALAFLHLKQAAKRDPNCRTLIVLAVPEISERLKATVYAFIETYSELLTPDWLLLSETGRYYGILAGQQTIGQLSGRDTGSRSFLDHYIEGFSKPSTRQRVPSVSFSGNHQWMLKFLLLNGIEPKYWGAQPFLGQWNSNTLRVQAGFNTAAQAHTLLTELERAGYLVKTHGQMVFRDLRRLFEQWVQAYRLQKHGLVPLAPLYPGESFDEWRDKKGGWFERFNQAAGKANVPVLVGGHMGCFALGVGWSNNPSILFHATTAHPPSLERFLRAMELKATDNVNSPIQLQLHKYQKPVLDVVELEARSSGRAVDIIQCVLDVSLMGGRGEEQADRIFDQVLFPHFRKMGWSH